MSTVPFSERGGKARGCLDLVSGRFRAFVFGGGLGALLPVFHFHDVTREELEPKLRHLADNGYRSVISDEIAAYVRGDLKLPARSVGLCFDDAWRSVASVAAPLLEHYGQKAITYAIPARITDKGEGDSPFVTWSELSAIHASGDAPFGSSCIPNHVWSRPRSETAIPSRRASSTSRISRTWGSP